MKENVSSVTIEEMSIIQSARIEKNNIVQVLTRSAFSRIKLTDISITPDIEIKNITREENRITIFCSPFDLRKTYTIRIGDSEARELQPDGILDTFYSEKPLGCTKEGEKTAFRLFAPRAIQVQLVLFNRHDNPVGQEFAMTPDDDGIWELFLEGNYYGNYYGYRVTGPESPTEAFDPDIIIADPYSFAVASQNHFYHPSRTLILAPDDFDWDGQTWIRQNWRDLIILEAHIRDLTAHASANVDPPLRGSYSGLSAKNQRGGIDYLKSLGVNAVELLPVQEFANFEIPYKDSIDSQFNNWNPYERNHWGYMTTHFFAPESYYASGANAEPNQWPVVDGRQVREFKEMIKALHQAGIAVIMDVVYNHTSQYDWNPFKLIDKKYYYRLDDDQNYQSLSGCGNDFKTERPMARRLILDSVLHWMREYHIDGFRFDLGALIDRQTLEQVISQARKINPEVFLTAEPWGGGRYIPSEFSRSGWAVWNDQFRNGVKGQNPFNGLSFIFGKYWGDNNIETMKRYIRGSVNIDGGAFVHPSHSVNYLESHDDHTLGDFIRIGTGEITADTKVTDLTAHATLSEKQLRIHKLAALILLTSQGAVMIAEGQDWGRSKVIAMTEAPDAKIGHIDHNSYNKDDETNYLNFNHRMLNPELVNYYQELIALRKQHPALRRTIREDITFFTGSTELSLGFFLDKDSSGDNYDFIVLLNGNQEKPSEFHLPDKNWKIIVDQKKVSPGGLKRVVLDKITVPPISGMVLIR